MHFDYLYYLEKASILTPSQRLESLMKKLLVCLVISSLFTQFSYSEKALLEDIYDALLYSEVMDIFDHMSAHNYKVIKSRLADEKRNIGGLFPGIERLIRGTSETKDMSKSLDNESLYTLYYLAEKHPDYRPFVKQGVGRPSSLAPF